MMAITVLCAETDEEANLLATSREVWAMRLLSRGEAGPVPSIDEALAEAKTPEGERWIPRLRRRSVVGSPKTVRAGLEQHAMSYQVDEIMAVTICYDFTKRKRSYELLAEEFGLAPS